MSKHKGPRIVQARSVLRLLREVQGWHNKLDRGEDVIRTKHFADWAIANAGLLKKHYDTVFALSRHRNEMREM